MGGMNVAKFGSTYGGEDWDFFDRYVLAMGPAHGRCQAMSATPVQAARRRSNQLLLSSFIARGLICDELKVPGFLHHAHAHSGMWNASALVYDGLRLLFATINSGAP